MPGGFNQQLLVWVKGGRSEERLKSYEILLTRSPR